MTTPYTKPHLPIPDQVALLKRRGLTITDDARAEDCLRRIGYYRLSGYWYPLRQATTGLKQGGGLAYSVLDDFKPGARLEDVVDLYVFDKKLRLLMLDALERVEVALRVDVALHLGALDPLAHRDPHRSVGADVPCRMARSARQGCGALVRGFRTPAVSLLPGIRSASGPERTVLDRLPPRGGACSFAGTTPLAPARPVAGHAHALTRSRAFVLCGPDGASVRMGLRLGFRDRLISLERPRGDAGFTTTSLRSNHTRLWLERKIAQIRALEGPPP